MHVLNWLCHTSLKSVISTGSSHSKVVSEQANDSSTSVANFTQVALSPSPAHKPHQSALSLAHPSLILFSFKHFNIKHKRHYFTVAISPLQWAPKKGLQSTSYHSMHYENGQLIPSCLVNLGSSNLRALKTTYCTSFAGSCHALRGVHMVCILSDTLDPLQTSSLPLNLFIIRHNSLTNFVYCKKKRFSSGIHPILILHHFQLEFLSSMNTL